MRTGEAHTLEALDLSHCPQEVREGTSLSEAHAIRINVLPQESDFNGAFINDGLDFFKNLTGTAVSFFSSQMGNDAEGAGVIATN